MGAVQFYNGVVLFNGGKVAMDPDCCCGQENVCNYYWQAYYDCDEAEWFIVQTDAKCQICDASDWVVDPTNDCIYTCVTCEGTCTTAGECSTATVPDPPLNGAEPPDCCPDSVPDPCTCPGGLASSYLITGGPITKAVDVSTSDCACDPDGAGSHVPSDSTTSPWDGIVTGGCDVGGGGLWDDGTGGSTHSWEGKLVGYVRLHFSKPGATYALCGTCGWFIRAETQTDSGGDPTRIPMWRKLYGSTPIGRYERVCADIEPRYLYVL
jgi:hypothetical protein